MSWFRQRDKTRKHSYFEERLSTYIDGELTPREQETVEQHLATCPNCRWNLSTLRQTVQRASELPAVQVPRAFTIPAAAEPVRPARRSWTLLPVLQGATALVALLLVFAVAGDAMLTGFAPRGYSGLPAMQEEVNVAETVLVEKAVEEERQVEATVVVAAESEAQAITAPAMPEPPAAEPEAEMMLQVAPSAPMTATGTTSDDLEEVAETVMGGGMRGTDAASAEEAEDSPVPTGTPLPAAEVMLAPTPLPSLAAPETRAALVVPTSEVLASKALEPSEGEAPAQRETGLGAPAIGWLRTAEYALGVALILLIGTTLTVVVWRRMMG